MNLPRLLGALLFIATGPAFGQAADLLISEYIEGSSFNKAVEIYNGTGAAVDLTAGAYDLQIFFNGNASAGATIALTGSVIDGDVYVVADDGAGPAILAEADLTPTNGFFNGDDAVVLRKNGVVIDSLGQVGSDPGSEWSGGGIGTQNETLRRKVNICAGDANDSDPFDPSVEWDGFAQDTFGGLGSHTANCVISGPPQLLMTEIVVTPTAGEFVEIFNPNGVTVDLSDVYLTDATFAGGSAFYYNIVTGANAGGGGFGDFLARFPAGATIAPGAYQTVAMAGSDGFNTTYGFDPDYELFEDGAVADAIPDMLEGLAGSINSQGGLTNSGEVAILFNWDGSSDLVVDLDYVVWGDKAEAVDKTGISIDGPDADAIASAYLNDTPIATQEVVSPAAHAGGSSYQREDLLEGSEAISGGNGANGHDETSEDLSNTWCEDAPTPGSMTVCMPVAASGVVINEINADPDATNGDANGDGTVNTTQDEFLEIVNNTGAPLDLSGWTISDGVGVRHTFPAGTVIADQCAVLVFGGGTPTGVFGGATAQTASSGALGLNNGGDSITLNDGVSNQATAAYGGEGGNNQSLTLDPDITGVPPYVQHTGATGSGGALFSAGTQIDGSNFPGCFVAPPIVINEISADPDAANGDANGDGTVNTSQDEFVEIVNNTGAPLDLSGWTISDGVAVRHTFPAGTVVADQCAAVVFGGGTPTGGFQGATVQTASSGLLGLNNGGDTVTLNNGVSDQAMVSYGGEGGNNQSLTLDPDISGMSYVQHTVATGSGGALFSPGTQINGNNFPGCNPPPPVLVCGAPATFINEVQGAGLASPIAGVNVEIEGVVVADFQGVGGLGGFFLQEEDADHDANPLSSEGVFVFDDAFGVDVAVGDRVRVAGTVEEFFDETQVSMVNGVAICASGVLGEVTRTDVNLPAPSFDDLEAVEGMWARLPQSLTVTDVFNVVRFGEFVVSNGRLYQPTQIVAPGAPAQAQEAANNLNRIIVDDGRIGANQLPFLPGQDDINPLNATNPVRNGFTVTNIEGAVGFAFGSYRLQSIVSPVFEEASQPRPAPPAPAASHLKVASFNVLNYFTTLDQPGNTCGPNLLNCRGANTASELARQTDKLVQALVQLDADIIGLIEVENNPSAAVQALVDGMNAMVGAGTWGFIDTGEVGTDAVKPAFIYNTTRTQPSGPFAILDETVDPRFDTSRQRPSIAQTFVDSLNGKVTAIVNHLRSKASCPGDMSANDDSGDGQACWNEWRRLSMAAMVDWVLTDPTGSGDGDFLLIGDFNANAQEDPMQELINAGYTNLDIQFNGGNPAVYSFTIFGLVGSLDHAIANPALLPQVVDTQAWHINADEYRGFDYNEEDLPGTGGVNLPKPANFYNVDPYRTSDHDPLLVSLNLDADASIAFAAANSNFAETAGMVNVAINLNAMALFDAQVRVQSTGGSAISGVDYTAVDQIVTIAAGATTADVSIDLLDDLLVEGNETITLTLSNAQGAQLGAISSHSLTITDDDTAGITVNPTAGLMTDEGGATDVFSVVLDSAPLAEVTIPVVSNNTAEGTVSAAQLLFDVANWNVPQAVTVTGVDDALVDGDQNYTIVLGPTQSTNGAWDGLFVPDVDVTNVDNDVAITLITGPTSTGTGIAAISFTGGGPGCTFDPATTQFIDVGSVPLPPPAGLDFPHGLVQLQATGCTVGSTLTFDLVVPQAVGLSAELWKFGPPSVGANDAWFEFPGVISGDTITYSITDGGLGDGDGLANGVFVDPAGVAVPQGGGAVAIPTLSRWGLILMLMSILAMGAAASRRRIKID